VLFPQDNKQIIMLIIAFVLFALHGCNDLELSTSRKYVYEYQKIEKRISSLKTALETKQKSQVIKKCYDTMLTYSRLLKNDTLTSQVHTQISNYYFNEKYLDSAAIYMDSALVYLPNISIFQRTSAYIQLGNIYELKRDFPSAYAYLKMAISTAQKSQDSLSIMTANNTIGINMYQHKKYSLSKEYFENALIYFPVNYRINKQFEAILRLQEIHDNLGLVYQKLKMYDKALEEYQSALSIIDMHRNIPVDTTIKIKKDYLSNIKYQSNIGKSVIYSNLGSYYFELKKYDSALEYSNKSINYCKENSYLIDETFNNAIRIAKVYKAQNNKTGVRKYIKIIDSLTKDSLLRYYNSGVYALILKNPLPELYEFLGEKDQAYIHLKKVLKETNNQLDIQNIKDIKNINAQHDLIEREQKLEIYKKEEELQNLQYKFLSVGFALILALAVITSILAMRYRKNMKRNLKLNNELKNQRKILEKNEIELRNTNLTLEKYIEEKNHILSFVAHDLRSPIAAIQGLIQLMKMNALTEEEFPLMLNKIENLCQNTTLIISDIIEAARLEEIQTIDTHKVSVRDLLYRASQVMESIAERKKITIKIDEFPDEIYIQAQSEKIVRVLENLISNAIKFSFEKSDIFIGSYILDHKVVIYVKDEGIGIPENLRQKLFDRFTKSGRLGTQGEKSLGLGMNIVRKIVELHKGSIDIESAVGKGTTIKIILPAIGGK